MSPVGDGLSIATSGWIVTGAGDVTAPGQGAFTLASVTTTTAIFNITAPDVADYDHVDLSYTKEGESSDTVEASSDGTIEDLVAGTWYSAIVCAFDTSGNRGPPSPAVRFRTLQATAGTNNFTVQFKMDEAASYQVSQECDIAKDKHAVPIKLRGHLGELRVRMTEVDQDVLLIGYMLSGRVLDRSAD